MFKNKRAALAAGAIVAATLVAGTIPAEATGSSTLKVGIVLPLTGGNSKYGVGIAHAAQMGVADVNAAARAAGLTAKCQLVGTEDDQDTTAGAVEATNKLIKSSGAQVIVGGGMKSSIALVLANSVTIPANVPMIGVTSSSPLLSSLNDHDTYFRVYPSDNFQATALVKAMSKAFGSTAKINVGSRNDAFGTGLANAFAKQWKANGGTIGANINWDPNASSLDSQAAKLAAGSPDGWLIVDYDTGMAKLAPGLVKAGGWDAKKTFMTEDLNNAAAIATVEKVVPGVMEGIRGTSGSSLGVSTDAWAKKKAAAYPSDAPTFADATGYDAAVLACLANIQAQGSGTSFFTRALRRVSGPAGAQYTWQQLDKAVVAASKHVSFSYMGAWGEAAFDKNGDTGAGKFDVYKIHAGQAVINPADTLTFSS